MELLLGDFNKEDSRTLPRTSVAVFMFEWNSNPGTCRKVKAWM